MPIEPCPESQTYKHALLCYAALAGTQPDEKFHFKLLDVIDLAFADSPTVAKESLAETAFVLILKLANTISDYIVQVEKDNQHPRIHDARLCYWARIDQVIKFTNLDKCQSTQMVIGAIDKVLKDIGPLMLTTVIYPDLEKLRP